MTRLGVAVPPGFTITSEACNAYLDEGETLPDGVGDQLRIALAAIEKQTGKTFGDPSNPLLLSCRSGAKFSMPGMMDTVLNIGLNDEVASGIAEIFDDRHFALDSYRRLIQMFSTVVMGIPDEPFEETLREFRERREVDSDGDLSEDDLASVVDGSRRSSETIRDASSPRTRWNS